MKKLIYLCSTILLATVSIAQARVEFIAKDSGITFKSPKSVGCPEGMRNYNGKCFPICKKNEYPLATRPNGKKGIFETCDGVPPRYRYKECYVGYEGAANGDCVLRDCSAYPLKESELNRNIGNVESCQSGDVITYKYTKCYNHDAWDLVEGKCVPHYCQTNLYPYDYAASAPNNKVGHHKFCYSGEKTYWGYTDCIQQDWGLEGGQCWNQCTGYNSLINEIDGCAQTAYCVAKDGTKYKCVQCKNGYQINDTNSCDVVSCPYGQVDPEQYWCDDKWKYIIPDGECSQCPKGHYVDSKGVCSASPKDSIGISLGDNLVLAIKSSQCQEKGTWWNANNCCQSQKYAGHQGRLPTLSEAVWLLSEDILHAAQYYADYYWTSNKCVEAGVELDDCALFFFVDALDNFQNKPDAYRGIQGMGVTHFMRMNDVPCLCVFSLN